MKSCENPKATNRNGQPIGHAWSLWKTSEWRSLPLRSPWRIRTRYCFRCRKAESERINEFA